VKYCNHSAQSIPSQPTSEMVVALLLLELLHMTSASFVGSVVLQPFGSSQSRLKLVLIFNPGNIPVATYRCVRDLA
jgi:hypothetical protein